MVLSACLGQNKQVQGSYGCRRKRKKTPRSCLERHDLGRENPCQRGDGKMTRILGQLCPLNSSEMMKMFLSILDAFFNIVVKRCI